MLPRRYYRASDRHPAGRGAPAPRRFLRQATHHDGGESKRISAQVCCARASTWSDTVSMPTGRSVTRPSRSSAASSTFRWRFTSTSRTSSPARSSCPASASSRCETDTRSPSLTRASTSGWLPRWRSGSTRCCSGRRVGALAAQASVSTSPSRYAKSSSEIVKSTSAFSAIRDGVVVFGNGSTSFSSR